VGGRAGRGGVAAAVHRGQRRLRRFHGVEPSGSQRATSPRDGSSDSEQGPDATLGSNMNVERSVKRVAPIPNWGGIRAWVVAPLCPRSLAGPDPGAMDHPGRCHGDGLALGGGGSDLTYTLQEVRPSRQILPRD
jgi:hypothetical protein